MPIKAFKILWKKTLLIRSETLLKVTFPNIFFTLTKRQMKVKRFCKFQNCCFSERIATLSSIWKERDSGKSREKGVLCEDVLENYCSNFFLKVSFSKFMVKHLKLPLKIWKPITLLNSIKLYLTSLYQLYHPVHFPK